MTATRPAAGLAVGPATRERAARVLEQQLGAVWQGILESHGCDPDVGWRLEVGELRLVPAPPAATENGTGRA